MVAILKQALREEGPVMWRMMRAGLIAAVLLILAFATNALSHVEGRLWPVMAGTDITRAVEGSYLDPITGETIEKTIFYGTARKLRVCDFERVDWYLRGPGGKRRLSIDDDGRERIHDAGRIQFGPWGANLTRAELVFDTYAVMWHRCHPGWLTATRFYP